jgi:hypothetical protein
VKFSVAKTLRLSLVVGFAWVTMVGTPKVQAQAPPGPLPQSPSQDPPGVSQIKTAPPNVPRTKILAGTWRLNTDDSDDPGKKMQLARGSGNRGQGGGRRGGGGMGGGWPGGGVGGRGGGRGTGGGESDSDRQKMQLFVAPAQQLTVSGQEPETDVADDADRKFILYTDGRKIEKSKDPNHQEFSAKWEEFRLTAEGKDPHGNKYLRSYEVMEGNQQLRETLLLKVGRDSTEISIRYVYDRVAPGKSPAPPAS